MDLKINQLSTAFDQLTIFRDLDLIFPKNKITCILGPSGCGKTTLLNILSNILEPEKGDLSGIKDHTCSYLFQDPRLLPWKTVAENIEIVLKKTHKKSERSLIVNQYIQMVGLEDFKNYYPAQLSGGMKQRVSIARAFAFSSQLLLMDEPFTGLDLKTKTKLIHAFLKLWQNDKRTVVYVTHSIDEAILLADKIYIFSKPPVEVLKTFTLSTPRSDRSLKSPALLDLKESINDLFFE